MPELRHLRYFVAVAEELNFSRAAERLHMAQPPLSYAIRQLEREVGSELFERTTREVKLTAAGRAALAGAYRTLAEVDRTMADARRAAAGETGLLRIGYSWSARFGTLPAIGRAFRAEHPDVELLTEEMWNARMVPALRSGAIDVALSLCPEIDRAFAYERVRTERVVALLGTGHARAGEREISLSALSADTFLLFPRELGPRLYDAMVGLCRGSGFEPAVSSQSLHTVWGLGELPASSVGLAPASVAAGVPEGMIAVALRDPDAQLDTAMVWRSDDGAATGAAFRASALGVFGDGTASATDSV